jgi:Ca-activated chloride channel homolog
MTLRAKQNVVAVVSLVLVGVATTLADRVQTNPDLVYVQVTATDSNGRYVSGLKAESFKVFEDKQPQGIVDFSIENTPISAVILLDVRESVKDSLTTSLTSAFRMDSRRGDQFFMLETGKAPLNETVYQGLEKVLQEGTHQRRVFLLFTDRGDAGATSFVKVKELVKKRDVQMFVVEVPNVIGTPNEQGRHVLRDLTNLSGGKSYFPSSMIQLERISRDIALDLRHQYRIGYRPKNVSQDGKWRNLRITAELPDIGTRKMVKYTVRARPGNYGPGK